MSLLALDGGVSATKWRLADRQGQAPPLHGHLFAQTARDAARETMVTLAAELRAHGTVREIVAGISGLSAGSEVATWYRRTLAEAFQLEQHHVLVADDLSLVCLGTTEPGKGMLVYAGTGTVAYYLPLSGQPLRAGGRGCLVDDAGGGFWIGAQALRWLSREMDAGLVPDTRLAEALCARFGGLEWEALRQAVYGEGRPLVASLSREVLAAAEAGDPVAQTILSEAGTELATLANRLFRASQAKALEVRLIGGVTACGTRVTEPMRRHLAPGLTLIPSDLESTEAICKAVALYGIEGLAERL